MDKKSELKKLEEEMAGDINLPLRGSNLVFGEGSPDCEVLFIGEAPGMNEDRERRPFVGRAGQLLRKHIRTLGWKEEDVYITNIVKRRPPENRDPLPEEIESYKPYLARQIEIIAPKIIIPLGRFSMNYFLPFAKITRDQGKLFSAKGGSASGGKATNYYILPMLHPAAALRGNEMMNTFAETFAKLPKALEKVKSGNFDESVASPQISQKQKRPEDVQAKLF
ncbi:uracil-DNA glycosylase [Candidatus Nomurabacteria bacterium]|nr:uracil-DNA glycosylase [Candidatus Nomurabacteria bacterium]